MVDILNNNGLWSYVRFCPIYIALVVIVVEYTGYCTRPAPVAGADADADAGEGAGIGTYKVGRRSAQRG